MQVLRYEKVCWKLKMYQKSRAFQKGIFYGGLSRTGRREEREIQRTDMAQEPGLDVMVPVSHQQRQEEAPKRYMGHTRNKHDVCQMDLCEDFASAKH